MKRQFNLLGIYWIAFCLIYCIGIDQVYVIEIPDMGRKLFSIAFLMSDIFKWCLCAFLMGGIFVFARRMKQNDGIDTNEKIIIETWWKSIFMYQLAFALFQVTNNSEKVLYYAAMRVLMISPVAVWLSLTILASGLLFVTGKRFKVKDTRIFVLRFNFMFFLTFLLFQTFTLLIADDNYLSDGTNLKPLFSMLWFFVLIIPGLSFIGYGRKVDQYVPLPIEKEKKYDLLENFKPFFIITIILMFLFFVAEYVVFVNITIDMYFLDDILFAPLQRYALILCLLLPLTQIAVLHYVKKKEQANLSKDSDENLQKYLSPKVVLLMFLPFLFFMLLPDLLIRHVYKPTGVEVSTNGVFVLFRLSLTILILHTMSDHRKSTGKTVVFVVLLLFPFLVEFLYYNGIGNDFSSYLILSVSVAEIYSLSPIYALLAVSRRKKDTS